MSEVLPGASDSLCSPECLVYDVTKVPQCDTARQKAEWEGQGCPMYLLGAIGKEAPAVTTNPLREAEQ